MYCKHCGKRNSDDAKFCDCCGASLENGQSQPVINIVNTNTNTNINSFNCYRHKKRSTAFWLCLFFGAFGAHRFYVGKSATGLLYLFTAGLGIVGVMSDLVLILFGGFHDKAGQPLV